MAGHSPGPWRTGKAGVDGLHDTRHCVYDPRGGRVASAPDHNPNALADAALIAVAPELLAALRKMTDELRQAIEGSGWGYPIEDGDAVLEAEALLKRIDEGGR